MTARRVVVADDEAVLRRELSALLREEGFDVVAEAVDGDEAVAAAKRFLPDVLVVDLRMPGTSGIDATRRIRELGLPVRIVLLSAYDDEALRQQAAAAGADGYLVKGCPAVDVIDAITNEGTT